MPDLAVLAINCSPGAGGRTRTALEAVLAGSREAGADTALLEMGAAAVEDVVRAMDGVNAFVFGSPMYRASYASPFKVLLDATPRGMHGEPPGPLTARAVLTVATAASDHHFLAPQAMRNVLVDFFSAHLVSPGLYLNQEHYADPKRLTDGASERARSQGFALVELARAISGSTELGRVSPNA